LEKEFLLKLSHTGQEKDEKEADWETKAKRNKL